MSTSNIVVLADLHCGHRSGLTPPQYQYKEDAEDELLVKFGKVQSEMWKWYADTLEKLQPIDTVIVNGDAIDGKSDRSGGTELITADRRVQCQMASDAVKLAKAKRIYIIKGTPYHTGYEEDWEEVLGEIVGADHVGNHEWFESEGVTIDCKHNVSGSVIPHGRFTALARQALWNSLWAERAMQPKAQILIRSHRHFYVYCGDASWVAISTPALQAWTKFGSNIIEGSNDIGLISIRCEDGRYTWEPHLLDMTFTAARSLPA